VIDLPATFSSEIWQLTDALPSISTGAAPALARRRAAILGRGDVELLTQGSEKVRVLAHLYPVFRSE